MCGIAGYFGPQIPNQSRLEAVSKVLHHRGPDGEGSYTHEKYQNTVALVHRRLAIIDLESRSNQPFRIGDKVLVFNGEIYNYIELRQELKSLGYSFKTESDTEVLACALLEWGEAALDRLEGMWAFAWYDESSGILLLSRDRFGEKPLYIWRRKEGFYFASEVKGIAALAGIWPKVNATHLLRYLVNGYKSLYKIKDTFFGEIEELSSATLLKLSQDGKRIFARYWMPHPVINETITYGDAVTLTRDAVINAVSLRMRSDVALAFCMSGGVDSNTLIATAIRELGCDVHGFTIINTDSRYEEQTLVEQSVRELNIHHTAVTLEKCDFLDNLRQLVLAHDGPVSTISYYVHWQLMRAMAAAGYRVTVSGTGADELFTGYYDHHNLYLYEVSGNPALYKPALAAWQRYQSHIVRNPFLQDPNLYVKDSAFRDHIYLNNQVFSDWLIEPWMEPFDENDYGLSLLRNRMMNELFAEAIPVILHEDDLNSMSFSMENRSPFLDRNLFDLAYSIPSRHLIQDGQTKSILRESMRDIVPDPILDNRRKVGFNAPILNLLDIENSSTIEFLLDNDTAYNFVKKDKIESLLRKYTDAEAMPNSVSKFLFNFVNMKFFLESFS